MGTMTEPTPSSVPQPHPQKTLALQPSFASALRGVWSLTWRSQITFSKLWNALIGLLALPVLIYLTTSSPDAWKAKHRLNMGVPGAHANAITKRLARAQLPIDKDQRAALTAIIAEEFLKAEQAALKDPAEPSKERQVKQREDCHNAILQRASTLLNERQLTQLENINTIFQDRSPAFIQELHWNRYAPFYHWLIDVYFFILLPLHCVRHCGSVIRDELEAATLTFLTTRPVSRAGIIVAKFLAQTAWLQLWMLVQTLLVFAAAGLREMPAILNLLPLFLAIQALAVCAWCALGLFLGQITKRYMGLALLYGAVVELGLGRIPTNINTVSIMRHLQSLLSHNEALQSIYSWSNSGIAGPSAAVLHGTAFFVICAALLFTYREYHPINEMQK